MTRSRKEYKTPIGAVPKIVNNFKPKTDNQKLFHTKIGDFNNQLILCHGIAGTGKTYVSIYKIYLDKEHHMINLLLSIQRLMWVMRIS